MKWILAFLLIIGVLSCKQDERVDAQAKAEIDVLYIDTSDIVDKLMYYHQADDCETFFYTFPSEFDEFVHVFEHPRKSSNHIVRHFYIYIDYFFSCNGIDPVTRMKKAFSLSLCGEYNADAIYWLQKNTRGLIRDDPQRAIGLLDEMSRGDEYLLWYFLFDGFHPSSRELQYKELKWKLGNDNPHAIFLAEVYEELLANEHHH